jgi:hypothetical protein
MAKIAVVPTFVAMWAVSSVVESMIAPLSVGN